MYNRSRNYDIATKRMSWAGRVTRMGRGDVYTGFWWGKPDGKSPFGRPRHRWEDNMKMDLRKWNLGAWTGLIWLRIGKGGWHL